MSQQETLPAQAEDQPVSPIWPEATRIDAQGAITFHGMSAASLLEQYGSPLYVVDTDEIANRAQRFVNAAQTAFNTTTTQVSYAGKALLTKRIVRIMLDAGMHIDTCTMGEARIALAAGAPGRRLVLHGNNKTDDELRLAISEGFDKIVVDSPDEPERIARIASQLGKRARVMLRVTSGIHAGGHEYISTAHEDQKFGVPLLPVDADPQLLDFLDLANNQQAVESAGDRAYSEQAQEEQTQLVQAMECIAQGSALAVLQTIKQHSEHLELVGIHSHIGSQIHDATAFIHAAQRMMLLRKTFYATDGITLPEVDLGGGYSVAYTDTQDSMNIEQELGALASAVMNTNRMLGMPMPVISFEPGRWIVAPAGANLYTVGTVKAVQLQAEQRAEHPVEETTQVAQPAHITRTYVAVDGGMSDNIRPALYDAQYTARIANRSADMINTADLPEPGDTQATPQGAVRARIVGMHCESGDILVYHTWLPEDIHRGDIVAIPVTGAYGRTMASNYNQATIPAVVAVNASGSSVMLRRQSVDDLLELDQD